MDAKTKPLLLGGAWRETGQTREVRSPYNSELLAHFSVASQAEVEEAIAAAARAAAEMRELPRHRLAESIRLIADGIRSRAEEFARTIALEAGKPIKTARAEVERAVMTFTYASEESRRFAGEVVPLDGQSTGAGRTGWTERFPRGVVFGITPFNFPLNLVAHKVAPALGSRNSIIVKPSPRTPLTALLLGEVFLASGLPASALQIVPMEIETIASAFAYAGQVCISAQRVLVHESIAEDFTARFVEKAKSLRAGDPLDEATELSNMIDEQAARRAEAWIDEAVAAGARLLAGGRREGSLLEATVLTDVHSEMRVCSEEVFAPVATLQTFGDFEEALTEANNTRYGLQAGVFTHDVARALRALRALDFGGVIVNDSPAFRVDNMPYGGVKLSGAGREGIRYAMLEMTEPRLIVIDPQH